MNAMLAHEDGRVDSDTAREAHEERLGRHEVQMGQHRRKRYSSISNKELKIITVIKNYILTMLSAPNPLIMRVPVRKKPMSLNALKSIRNRTIAK